jgi:predicted nucleic acid-binding protein
VQREFLAQAGIDFTQDWTVLDSEAAHAAWSDFCRRRRAGKVLARRPVADVFIGAFARRLDGLVTRDSLGFKSLFPGLKIRVP